MSNYIPVKFSRAVRNTNKLVTPNRIRASKKALTKQLQAYPLLADHVAEELGITTPEDLELAAIARVNQIDKVSIEYWQRIRDHDASNWRRVRKILNLLPRETRDRVVEHWNASKLPKKAEYFLDYLRCIDLL